MRTIGFLLLAFLAGIPAQDRQAEEWSRELPPGLHLVAGKTSPATHFLTRVVDAVTGSPISGARIQAFEEVATPLPGAWAPVQTVLSDRDGLAMLDLRRKGDWLYVEAPGHGPVGEMGPVDTFRLKRGVDVTLEVRDWLDRPLAGARIELMLGCGHSPAVRRETSDANGRLSIRCVDPERGSLWVRAAGAAGRTAGYAGGIGALELVNGVRVLRCDPAPAIEGIVLDHRGRPAPGLAVGTRETHRGPWTLTEASGRFRLLGAPAFEELMVLPFRSRSPAGDERPLGLFETAPGVITTVRLQAPEETTPKRGSDAPRCRLNIRLESPAGSPPTRTERVVLVRRKDGRVHWKRIPWKGGSAAWETRIEAGEWTVTAGTAAGRFRPRSERVQVLDQEVTLTLNLEENPRWRPVILERTTPATPPVPLPAPWEGTLSILTAGGRSPAVPVPGEEGAIHVPAEGRFVVEYTSPDGRRARVRLEGPHSGPGPELLLPPARQEEPPPGRSTAPQPEFQRTRLRVLLPNGKPAAGATVLASRFSRSGGPVTTTLTTDEEGAVLHAFHPRDRVRITLDDPALVPLTTTLEGPGPWLLRWPETFLEVRAQEPSGLPIQDFTLVLPGRKIPSRSGSVRLRGAQPGPLRFFLDAEGLRARDIRVRLEPRRPRTLRIVLRKAP